MSLVENWDFHALVTIFDLLDFNFHLINMYLSVICITLKRKYYLCRDIQL
jgi:hypothetical protein